MCNVLRKGTLYIVCACAGLKRSNEAWVVSASDAEWVVDELLVTQGLGGFTAYECVCGPGLDTFRDLYRSQAAGGARLC